MDVAIIGAGIIGCAVGCEIARRGGNVRIFEARTVAAGATHASAGVLAPYIEAHDRGPLFDLTIRSLALYDRFIADTIAESGTAVEYRRCGTLEIAVDRDAADRLSRAPAGADSAELRWLTTAAARELEPALPASIAGALLAPSHGYVAVPQLTEALAWAALRHGAEIETGRRIISIAPSGSALQVKADDGAVWNTDRVVIAAGSWSGELAAQEPRADRVAVRPIRGQLLRLEWSSTPLTRVIWGPDCYVVPWQNGTVLVGATVEDVGFDERTTAAGVRDLLDAVCELLPEAWRAGFIEARVGLRPATPDGLPTIGPSSSVEGLFYATGHYRNGVLLAPLTAALVADLVLENRRDPVIDVTAPGP